MIGIKEILQLTLFSSSQNAASLVQRSIRPATLSVRSLPSLTPEALNPKPTAFVAERKGAPPTKDPKSKLETLKPYGLKPDDRKAPKRLSAHFDPSRSPILVNEDLSIIDLNPKPLNPKP